MKIIDPTYLRTINDGLNSGAIHKDNASALPAGLVGMYEAAFPPKSNVNNRKKVLDFFAVWSLLRREVSAAFVLPLLEGWTEEQLLEYIAQYSKWFNSHVSGKYQLYHERFRAFILQKISHQQFSSCNDLIINQCQRALLEKNGNEWELYALECLSTHLLITAIENGDDSALKSVSYNTSHWNRQVEISKGFDWSKRMLNDMMLWAYKYNEEEVIECALNKVDLHHLEQNDAPRIVELVAQNDIETALQRIESFGGNDKEGLERKFILYVLCLMELTLLESKGKPFRKDAIEKLLKHLDDNVSLNWSELLPDLLIKGIIGFLTNQNINYIALLKYSELKIDSKRLINYSDYNKNDSCDFNYRNDVILITLENIGYDIILEINEDYKIDYEDKAKSYFEIVYNHLSKDEYEEASLKIIYALLYSDKIPADDMWGSYGNHLKGEFASDLLSIGFHKIAIQVYKLMEKGEGWSDSALKDVSNKLLLKGDIKNLELLYFFSKKDGSHVFKCLVNYFYSNQEYSKLKQILFTHLMFEGNPMDGFKQLSFFTELVCSNPHLITIKHLIETDITKNNPNGDSLIDSIIVNYSSKYSLTNLGNDIIESIDLISRQELKAGFVVKYVKYIIRLNKGISYVLKNGSIREDFQIESYFEEIFIEICDFIEFDEAIYLISEINNKGTCRYDAAKGILKAYIASKQIEDLKGLINYHDIIQKIITTCTDEKSKDRMLSNLLYVLLEHSKFDEVLFFSGLLIDNKRKYYLLSDLFKKLYIQKNINEFENIIYEMLQCARLICDESIRYSALTEVSNMLDKLGDFKEASSVFREALESARRIQDVSKKSCSLQNISDELTMQGKYEEALTVMNEAIESAKSILDESKENCSPLFEISDKLRRQGKIDEALECSKWITSVHYLDLTLYNISQEYAKRGDLEKAFNYANDINNSDVRNNALRNMSDELIKQDKIDEAFECARGISNDYTKSSALRNISSAHALKSNIKEATSVMQKALEYARHISNYFEKSEALASISIELSKQGKYEEAIESLVGLNDGRERNNAINELLITLNKQLGINQGESIGIKITNSTLRNFYFNELSKYLIAKSKNLNISKQFLKLESIELKKWYLKNWVENIEISEVNKDFVRQLIYLSKDQIDLIEVLLQYYVINQMFFSNVNKNKVAEFESILNIKWAIDLKEKLN